MFLQIGKVLGKSYTLLFTVAAGGLVGANLAGFIPGVHEFVTNPKSAPDPDMFRSWVHGGWVVGAGLFFVGAVMKLIRAKGKDSEEKPRKRSRRGWRSSSRKGFGATINGRPCGTLGSIGVGALGGGLLGAMLGGSLLLFWFSLAYSPFAPADWPSSISVDMGRLGRPNDSGISTTHPVALALFFGPVILGAAVMGIASGIGATIERLKNRESKFDSGEFPDS